MENTKEMSERRIRLNSFPFPPHEQRAYDVLDANRPLPAAENTLVNNLPLPIQQPAVSTVL
jgi:hypothetical protein